MAESNPKIVIILGMHKTGTSMIGGVLSNIAVNMGIEMLGTNWENPLGFYEDKHLLELNELILAAASGTWDIPPDRETILANENQFSKDIANLIDKEQKLGIRGWKDPRMSLTIELYVPHLKNPIFVVTHRNNQAVAESLNRRDGIEIVEGFRLKKIYEDRIEIFFDENPQYQRLDLYYEEATKNPIECVNKLISFLEIQPSHKEYQDAVDFILPNEKMHKLAKKMRRYQLIKKGIKQSFKILFP